MAPYILSYLYPPTDCYLLESTDIPGQCLGHHFVHRAIHGGEKYNYCCLISHTTAVLVCEQSPGTIHQQATVCEEHELNSSQETYDQLKELHLTLQIKISCLFIHLLLLEAITSYFK